MWVRACHLFHKLYKRLVCTPATAAASVYSKNRPRLRLPAPDRSAPLHPAPIMTHALRRPRAIICLSCHVGLAVKFAALRTFAAFDCSTSTAPLRTGAVAHQGASSRHTCASLCRAAKRPPIRSPMPPRCVPGKRPSLAQRADRALLPSRAERSKRGAEWCTGGAQLSPVPTVLCVLVLFFFCCCTSKL